MKSVLVAFLLAFSSASIAAEEVAQTWKTLESQYADLVEASKFSEALDVALRLNRIDPADTQTLFYVVFASVRANKPVPEWVLREPWPDATPADRVRREVSEFLVKDAANKRLWRQHP